MALFRFPGGLDPFGHLRYMQREIERLMTHGGSGRATQQIGGGAYPPINVLSAPDELIVESEIPGVAREAVDLSITGETLVIKGTKPPSANESEVAYQRCERGSGDFSRTVVLPEPVDADAVRASLTDGVLTVHLPKSESAKPRQVKIN